MKLLTLETPIYALKILIVIFISSNTSYGEELWFEDRGYEIGKVNLCDMYNYNIYEISGNLKTNETKMDNGDACGKIFSFKNENNLDIFIFGVLIYNPEIKKDSYNRYRKWFSKSFLGPNPNEITFHEWKDIDDNSLDRKAILGESRDGNRDNWNVNDIGLRQIGDGTAVIFQFVPFVAWDSETEKYANLDQDTMEALADTRMIVDQWFERNKELIAREW